LEVKVTGRLENRIAVVTGGSRGIGAAIARKYAEAGGRVVIASRKQAGLDAVAETINAEFPGAVIPMACHVGRMDELAPWWDQVQERVGTPDILVNNAGTNPYFGPMLGGDWAAWEKTFEVNLKGPFEMIRQFVGRLEGRPGAVINVASILGTMASPMQGVYGMTKASIISMTQTLAFEFGKGKLPVRVNAIAPGVVDTRLAAALVHDPKWQKMIVDRTAMERVGLPEEIAGAALFLASDDASYVTGQVMTIDGGYTIG
jgi:NAD(P)-dependent dehydrogenase (short-subunit alcohol dehydrogenase family)